jgi:hypothetical protein
MRSLGVTLVTRVPLLECLAAISSYGLAQTVPGAEAGCAGLFQVVGVCGRAE